MIADKTIKTYPLTILSNYKEWGSSAALNGKQTLPFPKFDRYYVLGAIIADEDTNHPYFVFQKAYNAEATGLIDRMKSDLEENVVKTHGKRQPIIFFYAAGAHTYSWFPSESKKARSFFLSLGANQVFLNLNNQILNFPSGTGDVCYLLVTTLFENGKYDMDTDEASNTGRYPTTSISLTLLAHKDQNGQTVFDIADYD